MKFCKGNVLIDFFMNHSNQKYKQNTDDYGKQMLLTTPMSKVPEAFTGFLL